MSETTPQVEFYPSKKAKRLMLKALPNGTVRLVVPRGVPKFVAINFINKNKAWIEKHTFTTETYSHADWIGYKHQIKVVESDKLKPTVNVRNFIIKVQKPTHLEIDDAEVQEVIKDGVIKALRVEAKAYLPDRVKLLADIHGYEIEKVRIKNMTTRWGSCSNAHNINLNLHLMRLDTDLIDYVILHELTHTKHLNHSKDFWDTMLDLDPEAKEKAKRIKEHHPYL